MNDFDVTLISYINQFAHNSLIYDSFVIMLANNQFLKGGVIIALLWWFWVQTNSERVDNREQVISTLLSAMASMVIVKAFMLILPFRARPLHEEALEFIIPYGGDIELLSGWSSFPSDHAVLFFSLSMGIFLFSKPVGIFAFLYTTLLIALPRIYLGLHYPTDIIAGALLGIVVAYMGHRYLVTSAIVQKIVHYEVVNPALFYPLFFLFTFQIVQLFDSIRDFISWVLQWWNAIG